MVSLYPVHNMNAPHPVPYPPLGGAVYCYNYAIKNVVPLRQ